MFRIFCILIGYILGCIQTSYFTGRMIKKIDIRQHGSGNAGTTNTIRVMGRGIGVFVFVCDVLKAAIAYNLCMYLFDGNNYFFEGIRGILPGLYGGIGVLLGHNFPFFLNFKGGKGIASTIGVIICVDWKIMLIDFSIGIICVAVTKYISFASLAITLIYPLLLMFFGYPTEVVYIGVFIAILAWFQHRSNILRLLKGEENKFSFKKKV